MASLTDPNIARLLDAGHVDPGQPFLAMEYVDGNAIDAYAANLDVRHKIVLFLKVCAAVAYLHRHLLVHRDLKPSNILVAADGEPKLLDFGIAKLLDAAPDTTVTGMRMLTPSYASPEQVAGGRVTTATDIYSLGAVLYLLLTGKPAHLERSKRRPGMRGTKTVGFGVAVLVLAAAATVASARTAVKAEDPLSAYIGQCVWILTAIGGFPGTLRADGDRFLKVDVPPAYVAEGASTQVHVG